MRAMKLSEEHRKYANEHTKAYAKKKRDEGFVSYNTFMPATLVKYLQTQFPTPCASRGRRGIDWIAVANFFSEVK